MVSVLFVGVFDKTRTSTNTSQILSFKNIGCEVVGYDYRRRALEIGNSNRDVEIVDLVRKRSFDLVVYSKCSEVSSEVFVENAKTTKTCMWFMDPLISYSDEMRQKTRLVDYFCCDKENVLEEAKKYNEKSFHVCEGYDEEVDKPVHVDVKYDVSFIGDTYGDRLSKIRNINTPVQVINGVYGKKHAEAVCSTRINLNFCTSDGASDRVYKIMASGGFLLSDDWKGREKHFKDGQEIVIFKSVEDLNEKIDYYLKNPQQRKDIANSALKKVKKFNRANWAKRIIDIYEQIR
tara:strand:+ start:14843 stop:15715 length:873 start_codon:yes stop_codon:yes gene_type:complete